ncbi:MAG: hypothetical protein A2284_01100 [Deltaproteobacteria bacterium RIFOXYA12_FULL_61_11]|nr:MAG: hypothetical protein A2284_01100 [Deltaproteobacteria bacterium RIFOXYA12_FULL_61_11]
MDRRRVVPLPRSRATDQNTSTAWDLVLTITSHLGHLVLDAQSSTASEEWVNGLLGQPLSSILGKAETYRQLEHCLRIGLSGRTSAMKAWFEIPQSGLRFLGVTIYPQSAGREQLLLVAQDLTTERRALEGLDREVERMRRVLEDIIEAMVAVNEAKDPYTAIHQRRVSALASALALDLGLPTDTVEGVRVASLLHDIGKIYVPLEILVKPGKINPDEFKLIKHHVEVSQTTLAAIDFPWPIADIVNQHHERLDGSGYPLGLYGDDILLEAKIIAVADVVEAMATHRPYRPALGVAAALDEIRMNRGTLYEPSVVDSCLNVFERGFLFPLG